MIATRPAITTPKINSFFDSMRHDDQTGQKNLSIGVAGYCWEGKYAALLAHGKLVDCAFAAHPSAMTLPGDIEKIDVPFSMAIGDADLVMGMKEVKNTRRILNSKKSSLQSEVVVYPGAKHGFAVRGDPGNEKEKEQGLEAEDQANTWFENQLI